MNHRVLSRLGPAILISLMVLSVGFTAAIGAKRRAQWQWVSHTELVLATIESARAAQAEARYYERDTVLGGKSVDRVGRITAIQSAKRDIDDLKRLTADNPTQRNLLDRLDGAWPLYVRESDQVVESMKTRQARIALTMSEGHERRFDRASKTLQAMRAEESRLLAIREEALQRTYTLFNGAIVVTALVMGLFLSLLARLTQKERRARRKANDAVVAEKQALQAAKTRMESLAAAAFEGIAISQDGVVLDVNPAFVEMFGFGSVEEVRGLLAQSFAAPGSLERVARKHGGNEEDPYEALLIRPDGSTFEAELRGRRIDLDGRPARVTAIRDLSERKAAERALRLSEARMAEAQAVARVGSWSWDLATSVIDWSDETFRHYGMDPAQGTPKLDEIMTLTHPDDVASLSAAVQSCVQNGIPYDLDLRFLQPDGKYRWTHASGEGVRDANGTVVRLFGTLANIHDRKLLEGELRDSAERLRQSEAALQVVLGAAPVIMFATDAEGTITLAKGAGLAAIGLKDGEAVGLSAFEFNPGPEAGAAVRRALGGETVSFEAWRGPVCLHKALRPTFGDEGEVTGMIGVAFDVTERVRSEERFRVLFERSSEAHLIVGESGVIDCNPAAVELLRCENVDALRGIHPAVLAPEVQPNGRRSAEMSREMDELARRNGFHRFEWTHQRMDGTQVLAEVTLTHIHLAGRPALLAVCHDLSEIKAAQRSIAESAALLEAQKDELERANATLIAQQALLDDRLAETAEMNIVLEAQRYQLNLVNERLSALATTDGLTGLKNQRSFRERLAEECAGALRLGRDLSLLVLDVDKFKSYNDSFGHPAGDAALRTVADALGSMAREYDVAARNGGEEFALLLPGTDAAGATLVAERVRLAVEGGHWPLCPVTVSVGVATLLPGFTSAEEFVEAADRALYAAKEGGRDRVVVADGEVPTSTEPKIEPTQPSLLPYPVPHNERERLAALAATGLFGEAPEEGFDTIAEAAAMALGVPIALVTLVGEDKQWFKARVGIEIVCTSRDVSFCAHAMLETRPMVVEDLASDARFSNNPFVTGGPKVRFYAGAPILSPEGLPLGALCAVDMVPRQLTEDQVQLLERLARQAARLIQHDRGLHLGELPLIRGSTLRPATRSASA